MSNQNKMARALKNLAYVTELGFLLVIPLVLLLFLANFLQSRFGWGQWIHNGWPPAGDFVRSGQFLEFCQILDP